MNDIDDLLKNLKKNPSNRRVKLDAQTYLDGLKAGKNSDLAALDASITAINQEIEKDFGIGSQQVTTTSEKLAQFNGLEESCAQKVLGQQAYLHALHLALKRPFVMDKKQANYNKIFICGKKGSGRHSALQEYVRMLHQKGVFVSDQIARIDCSLYQNSEDEKIFIQDCYMAFTSASSILLIDEIDQLYQGFSNMILDLLQKDCIPLKKRYGISKNQLVEANNTLLTSAVASLELKDKYIILMSEKNLSQVSQLFGNGFIQAIIDCCETVNLSEETLNQILENELQNLQKQCRQLHYEISYDDSLKRYMIENMDPMTNVISLKKQVNELYEIFATHQLQHNLSSLKIFLSANQQIFLKINDVKQSLNDFAQRHETDDMAAIKQELNEIIGLQEVKKYMESLEANLLMQKKRAAQGFKKVDISMHMIFTGNPGTGKTTIARLVAKTLKAMGVLSGGQLVEVSRKDLVGKYVGHTAPLTQSMIQSALGGVLFIDEAYSLYRGKEDTFGLEAIDTLVKGMEDHRDDLIVILAGYTKEMNEFLEANSGLQSRFPNVIEFSDYTADELLLIAKSIAKSQDYCLNEDCDEPLLAYFEAKQQNPKSGNGRLARNVIEEAILNQAKRCLADPSQSYNELKQIDLNLTK